MPSLIHSFIKTKSCNYQVIFQYYILALFQQECFTTQMSCYPQRLKSRIEESKPEVSDLDALQ